MNEKFIVIDGTDEICIGGFGNDIGNIGLLKYTEEEIATLMMEYNNATDNTRLVNSLLRTIRNLDNKRIKAIEYIKNIENDGEYVGYLSMLVEDRDELLSILEGSDTNE